MERDCLQSWKKISHTTVEENTLPHDRDINDTWMQRQTKTCWRNHNVVKKMCIVVDNHIVNCDEVEQP